MGVLREVYPERAGWARHNSAASKSAPGPHPAHQLDSLRARIRSIERGGAPDDAEMLPLGLEAIDARLGGGLETGTLHEMLAQDAGAASAFAVALATRLLGKRGGAVLWCAHRRTLEAGALYGRGLHSFGLDSDRLIVVACQRDIDVLWAMEEGLRCARLAAVIGEADAAGLTATRRLQLAAGTSGVTALLLRPAGNRLAPSAAATRWRLSAAPSRPRGYEAALGEPGAPCWRVELLRCRAGAPGAWVVEWRDETGDLALAAPLRDRPSDAHAGRSADGTVRAGA